MEKTAMQMLIELIEANEKAFPENPISDLSIIRSGIKAKATELRDTVEKEQIENAFSVGTGWCEPPLSFLPVSRNKRFESDAEDFYNQTYKP